MQNDDSLLQEYTAFKQVWSRFVDRFRRLQCAYDRMAVANVYGEKSEQVQQYLTKYQPELRKLLKELPDPSGQGDAGLELLVDLLSSELRAASKSMVTDQVQSMFSSRNTLPKVVAAAFSNKRSRSSVDTSDAEAEFDDLMGSVSKLHSEVQMGTFTKKPRYRKDSRPKFRFSESQIWGLDPSEMLAYEQLKEYNSEEDTRDIEEARDAADPDYLIEDAEGGPSVRKGKGKARAQSSTKSTSGKGSSKKGKGKRA